MRSLLTLPGTFGMLRVEPRNSSVKVRQHLKRGLFFGVRTLEKYGVYSVISGREWANTIPCKGEYARRSQTVSSSRPFLRPAIANIEKSVRCSMFRFFLSSRFLRLRYRLGRNLPLDFRAGFRQCWPSPNQTRRSRRLPCAPHSEKSGIFCFCHQCTSGSWAFGCGYILAEQRPEVRETQAALFEPGSVVPPFRGDRTTSGIREDRRLGMA